jgi:hypothetical protein
MGFVRNRRLHGRAINASRLLYEFHTDGAYRVVVEDNFRSGIEAVIYETTYLKSAPEGDA